MKFIPRYLGYSKLYKCNVMLIMTWSGPINALVVLSVRAAAVFSSSVVTVHVSHVVKKLLRI